MKLREEHLFSKQLQYLLPVSPCFALTLLGTVSSLFAVSFQRMEQDSPDAEVQVQDAPLTYAAHCLGDWHWLLLSSTSGH